MKRAILVACTFATVMGSLAVAAPAGADGCPYGTLPTRFPGVCSAGQGGAPPAPIIVPPSGPDASSTPPGSAFATVDGIPCNQQHLGTCIGLSQQP
ncbi:hypothetical protein [Mycobacterium sp.]|uniref:hypothetical protein n=1 Tax=Mycobacterium sp. TaxID=1785 RepID=UPI002B9AA3C8|nr:hypothetical protein [Mycobacterium sp.]HKP42485.1 hypothetical protein [Mycobacterium sp.]